MKQSLEDADGDAACDRLDEAAAAGAGGMRHEAVKVPRADDAAWLPHDDDDVALYVCECGHGRWCDDGDPGSRTRCSTSCCVEPTRCLPDPKHSPITTCYFFGEAPDRRTFYSSLQYN